MNRRRLRTPIIVAIIAGCFGLFGAIINAFGSPLFRYLTGTAATTPATQDPAFDLKPISVPSGAQPQRVSWGPNHGREPGICVETCGHFIPWAELKEEVLRKAFPLTSSVPVGSRLELSSLGERRDWVVHLVDHEGRTIGHVWFGPDPHNRWRVDGRIRVGTAMAPIRVWATFERLADGGYRLR